MPSSEPYDPHGESQFSRRQALVNSATAVAAAALGSRLVLPDVASASGPKFLDIVDCHTHFYDPTRPQGVPWPGKNSFLYRTILPAHLRSIPQARPVTGTVIVEASKWVEDNQWLLDIAQDDQFVVGIVGHLTPGDEDFPAQVRRFTKDPLYRGIRVSRELVVQHLGKNNLDHFKLLADHDLGLDVNGGPETPNAVAELAEKIPDLRVVINHVGNVRIDENPPPTDWAEGMRKAAVHANVACKISALVEGASRNGEKPPTDVDFYRPYIDVVWNAFGEDRVIYGSNWPVSDRATDYKTLQQIVLDYVLPLGDSTAEKFFSLNAKRYYKWIERPGRLPNLPS